MNETVLEDETKYFWLVNGQVIRSIRQLIEKVPELTDEEFNYHVNDQKNDFFNWIMGIFEDHEVADLIKSIKTRDEFQEQMYNYLLADKQKKKDFVEMSFHEARKKMFMKNPEKFTQFKNQESQREEVMTERFDTTAKRLKEKTAESVLPKTITRIEALDVREKELREYITETRKEGRDPLLAEMVLRRFKAKADYAKVTQDEKDFDRAEMVIDEAEHELEGAVMAKMVDAKKEIELLVSFALAKEKKEREVREAPSEKTGERELGTQPVHETKQVSEVKA